MPAPRLVLSDESFGSAGTGARVEFTDDWALASFWCRSDSCDTAYSRFYEDAIEKGIFYHYEQNTHRDKGALTQSVHPILIPQQPK